MSIFDRLFGGRKKEDPVETYKEFLRPDFKLDTHGFNLVREALAAWDKMGKVQSQKRFADGGKKYDSQWEKEMDKANNELDHALEKIFKKEKIKLHDYMAGFHLHSILVSLMYAYKK